MINLKSIFFTLTSSTFLFANCSYNLDIHFNFNNQSINVSANVKSDKPIQLETKDFIIDNKKALQEENQISFSYKKNIENLNERFIYLLKDWYPKINQRCSFSIQTNNLTDDYKTVYENTKKQIDSLTFLASKEFVVNTAQYNDIKIKTYFLRDDKELVNKYFNKTIEYIKLYENKIGDFPYKEFKIVENIYQTGYSMATFTLIGSRLLEKDYILNQSLGHEILHQYFGNSIFIDNSNGNWAEGLTTFLADDFFKKQLKEDIENRKSILNQYLTFINEENEFPINEFKYRVNKSSSLIGYNKLSFVFHMLEEKIGEKKFKEIIKSLYLEYQFKNLNFNQLVEFINKNTQEDLTSFFNQWLYKRGIIDFKVENVKNYYKQDGFHLDFFITQNEKEFFEFDLPISIKTHDKIYEKKISITKPKQEINLKFDSEILEFTLDKNYNLFRKLTKNENFLTIGDLLEEENLIAIVNKEDRNRYIVLKKVLPKIKFMYDDTIKFKDIKGSSILFLDKKNSLLNYFYPNININDKNSYLTIKPNIYNENKLMGVLNFGEYKKRNILMLKYFSKYNTLIFTKEDTIKNIPNTENGIIFKLNDLTQFSQIKTNPTIKNISNYIKEKRIIYIGESHNIFEHHLNQLNIIKSLHNDGKDLAIAMEMFQKPFQKVLDDYIEYKIDLNEFLKKSEYYSRWGFDYNLYKPIIDYAKLNKIPLVAINIDRKINNQVTKASLLSLSKEQKSIAAKQIYQGNLEYKNSLKKIYEQHVPQRSENSMDFDRFYQSQLIWDESMAESIDNYLNLNPNKTLIVLAGSGHMEKHYGIPSRVFRRNSIPYQVILNTPNNSMIGDIVLKNKSKINLPKEKKLGVALVSNDNLTVLTTIRGSFAQKIGIDRSDKIIEIDDEKVNTIADIKRTLFLAKNLNTIKVTVLREGKEIELKLKK